MIAIVGHTPLVEFPDGGRVPFERRWLEYCLREAAGVAGLSQWHLEGHVAETVHHFLRWEYEEPTLSSARLVELIRRALRAAGYEEIGASFALVPPPVRLSLLEVAEEAGAGYELGFFALLGRRLRKLLADGARQIACEDLRPCVKRLRQARRWRGDCRSLGEEIVDFIRAEACRSAGQEGATGSDGANRSGELQLALS